MMKIKVFHDNDRLAIDRLNSDNNISMLGCSDLIEK